MSIKKHPLYRTWHAMKSRCKYPRDISYHNYGGRGITYDPGWEKFESFLSDMGERPEGTSLDRIDNDGNYCKENCRWADNKTQHRNRRDNNLITCKGETKPLITWAEEGGNLPETIAWRIKQGWDIHDAIFLPARDRNVWVETEEGKVNTGSALKSNNMHWSTYFHRIRSGMSKEEALSKPITRKTKRDVEFQGGKISVTQLSKEYGIGYAVLSRRLKLGWDIKRALTTPVLPRSSISKN